MSFRGKASWGFPGLLSAGGGTARGRRCRRTSTRTRSGTVTPAGSGQHGPARARGGVVHVRMVGGTEESCGCRAKGEWASYFPAAFLSTFLHSNSRNRTQQHMVQKELGRPGKNAQPLAKEGSKLFWAAPRHRLVKPSQKAGQKCRLFSSPYLAPPPSATHVHSLLQRCL